MTGTNHVLSGAIIGSLVDRPMAAVTIALASHIIADSLPHFGRSSNTIALRVLIADACIALCITLWLIYAAVSGQVLPLVCACAAVLPDALWIPYTLATHRGRPYSLNALEHALHVIQWGERPWGLIVEIPLACVMASALTTLL